jgi:hypothetical protein
MSKYSWLEPKVYAPQSIRHTNTARLKQSTEQRDFRDLDLPRVQVGTTRWSSILSLQSTTFRKLVALITQLVQSFQNHALTRTRLCCTRGRDRTRHVPGLARTIASVAQSMTMVTLVRPESPCVIRSSSRLDNDEVLPLWVALALLIHYPLARSFVYEADSCYAAVMHMQA